MLQETWGVDVHIEDVTCRYAGAGYHAFTPDLYSQKGKRSAVFERDRLEAVKEFLNTLPPPDRHDQDRIVAASKDRPAGTSSSRPPISSVPSASLPRANRWGCFGFYGDTDTGITPRILEFVGARLSEDTRIRARESAVR